MTTRSPAIFRPSSKIGRQLAFMTLLGALSLVTVPAFTQSADDVGLLTNQVDQLIQQGHYADAIIVAQRALAASERQFGPDDRNLVAPLNKLSWAYRFQGRYDQAAAVYQRGLAINEKALGPDHPDVVSGRETLADLYRIERRYSDAEQLLSVALATREKVSGPESIDVCLSLSYLAAVNETRGAYASAEPYRRRCLDIREKALGADHVIVGQSLHELARLYRKLGRNEEATPLYNRAIAVLGYSHPEAILATISAGDYARAAHALGLGSAGAGASDAVVKQIRRTFFGQVTDLRWIGYRYTDETGTNSRAGSLRTTTDLLLVGEAVHGNGLWQPFVTTMLPERGEWKLRANIPIGLAWKQ
jgi:tetratricopeptide (TPR) repeat protein